MILPEIVEKVLDTARVEEVVGDFVVLKKRGANYIGLCPFHNEKTPSFNVSVSKGIYKCFGCGAGGDSLRFVMEHEKLSFPDAIKYLARKYNIEIIESQGGEEEQLAQQEKESLYLVNQFARDWFEAQLWETEIGKGIGLNYFRERGFSDETIKSFRLGYHPEGYDDFTKAAVKAGYKLAYLVKVGLTIEKDGKYFDRFRGRVMFPIHNVSGKVIGFGGRSMTSDKKLAKYVNSPESEIYIKSNVLYGIDLARKEAVSKDEIYLVEGYTDVISLHQAGIKNVVASSGTSLTEGQIGVIRRYTSNVTILYDGDAAGIKASFRGIDMIISQGLNVKVLLFPDGEDPDSFARKNTPLFVSDFIQKEAKNFIVFKAGLLMQESGQDPIKRASVIKDLVHSISLIPDRLIRSLYVKECATITGMDEETLLSELNNQLRAGFKSRQAVNRLMSDVEQEAQEKQDESTLQTDESTNDEILHHEREIIRMLINYANSVIELPHVDESGDQQHIGVKVGDFIIHQIQSDEIHFSIKQYQEVFNFFVQSTEVDYPELAQLLRHPEPEVVQLVIDISMNKHSLSDQWKDKYEILINHETDILRKSVLSSVYNIKLRKLNKLMDENNRKLQLSLSDEEFDTLLKEQIWLNEVKKELSRQLHFVII